LTVCIACLPACLPACNFYAILLQVQKIRLLLRERGLGAIRVGTVDDYQGQEERIIFISTTLTKPESLPPAPPEVSSSVAADNLMPQRHHQRRQATSSDCSDPGGSWAANVGFFRNPKRFNVAITRAKALLVVVGSPTVLAADDNWRQLLRHCAARQAFK
jgi:putative helicase MOV10L1